MVHEFTFLGSTITDNLSLDTELNERIGKAATTLGRLTTRVWENPKLTTKTKMLSTIPTLSAPSYTGARLDNLQQARAEVK